MNKHPFRQWLEASGFRVVDIAKACGVSRSAVYNWGYGTSTPSVKHLAVLNKLSQGAVQPYFWTVEAPNVAKV